MARKNLDSAGEVAAGHRSGLAGEGSADKLCDDEVSSKGQAGVGIAAFPDGGRTQSGCISSRGSIEAADQVSSEPLEEQACTRRGAISSEERSSSLGVTTSDDSSEEDADASSARLHSSRRGSLPRNRRKSARDQDGESLPEVAGCTAKDKAANARSMAEAAWADAKAKALRAVELVAVAQQKMLMEERPLKRKKRLGLKSYVGPPSHVLLGARISVFWPDDNAFYKGRIVEVRDEGNDAKVVYDDDMEEWLDLSKERFQWLAPRACSAGATRDVQEEMARLGAEGVADGLCSPKGGGMLAAPAGLDAVGGCINIFCSGVGIWCHGEVLAYDCTKEMHHVLYEDGEHEWVRLASEAHSWTPKDSWASYPAGLPPGTAAPAGQSAIGWKVGLHWPDNSTFYAGQVIGYDNISGRHHVLYDSGDQEHVALDAVKVCWVMPPSVSSQAAEVADAAQLGSSMPDDSSDAALGHTRAARFLRRGSPALNTMRTARREQNVFRLGSHVPWMAEDAGNALLGFDDEDDLLDGVGHHSMDGASGLAEQADRGTTPAWWPHITPGARRAQDEPRPLHAQPVGNQSAPPWPLMRSPDPILLPPMRGYLLTSRHSMPDCVATSDVGCMDMGSAVGIALTRAMSMPETDSHVPNLGSAVDPMMDQALSTQLEPMDISLAGDDVDVLLLSGQPGQESIMGSSSMPLLGSTRHGSTEYESPRLSGFCEPAAAAAAEAPLREQMSDHGEAEDGAQEVAQFLCVAEDEESSPKEPAAANGLVPTLSACGGSTESLISDSSAVYLHGIQSLPSVGPSAKSTPQSSRHLLHWEDGQRVEGLQQLEPQAKMSTALVSAAPAEPLEPGTDLGLGSAGPGSSDGLVMTNELQNLLAEMDWG